jgi:hypothetical protein
MMSATCGRSRTRRRSRRASCAGQPVAQMLKGDGAELERHREKIRNGKAVETLR